MNKATKIKFAVRRPPMSLKQFMLRTEVLKLYRGFMRLGRLIEESPDPVKGAGSSGSNNTAVVNASSHPLKVEWIEWVRAEFKLRQATVDEEAIKMMLAHGKRQLQELERTILLATNRNSAKSISSTLDSTQGNPVSMCKSSK